MTNLELLEEIRKDFIFKKNNDPIINSTLLIFITKFKERMYKLDLPVVGRSIGKDTKPTLRTLTAEQKEGDWTACEHCIFKDDVSNYDTNCFKCSTSELKSDQYYY